MHRICRIIGIILVFFLFSSKTCTDQSQEPAIPQEDVIRQSIDSLKGAFETARLSEESFCAFEEKAKEKLQDMADYLKIIYQKNLDETFKQQAAQMLTCLFMDSGQGLVIRLTGRENLVVIPFESYTEDGLRELFDSIRIQIDSIRITMPLREYDPVTYTGQMQYTLQFCGYTGNDSLFPEPLKQSVEIILKKRTKSFGIDSMNVWGVYLGNIQDEKVFLK